jgi:hypothetical protein
MSYGPGDLQTMPANARDYLEGTYESDREIARQEWQASVAAYEDGLSDVEPVEWKEFWG